MFNWSAYDNSQGGGGNGGYGGGYGYPCAPVACAPVSCAPYGGGGGLFGGATGGAFVGGLAGSLVGDLFGGGRFGGNRGCGGDSDKVVQINGNGLGFGGYGNCGGYEIMKEVSDCRYDLASQNYQGIISAMNTQMGMNAQIAGLQMQICQCCDSTQRLELEGQYKALLASNGITAEIAECCCKELNAITCMGYETQLRDQANYGNIMKEMGEIKCLIKDTEKDSIIRAQSEKLGYYEGKLNVEEIKNAMKPPCPVPAYITCSPYENVLPTVKVARECHCDDNRWNYNNCGR